MLQARDWFWEDKSVPKEYFLVVSLVVHRQLSLVLKLKSAPISLNLSKPAHDQVQKYTVLMMNTQAVMMIVVILANLLLLLTGLKRCEYFFFEPKFSIFIYSDRQYQLMKLQKKQLALESQNEKADTPPSYEKVVIEAWMVLLSSWLGMTIFDKHWKVKRSFWLSYLLNWNYVFLWLA